MTVLLTLCRHTQTDENRDGIYTGQADTPLNTTGREQARILAARIAALPGARFAAILGSNLGRTTHLANLISQSTGCAAELTPDLREVNVGAITRLTKAVAAERYPDPRHRTANPDFDFRDIGGESAADVIARHLSFLRPRLAGLSHRRTARVVIVGHGSALRLVFRDHLGLIDRLHEQGDFQEVAWPTRL